MVFSLAILLLVLSTPCSGAFEKAEMSIKTAVFLSPKIELGPGSVSNKYYYDIDFPRGHVAIKSLNAELVDGAGNPLPLYETYLHHWAVSRYHQPTGVTHRESTDLVFVRNSGMCQGNVFGHYFGVGSETRRTATDIPDPFGLEIGNPEIIQEGYEEKWMLNVHAIDTRGVQDKMGCTECRCELYNVTKDEYDKPLGSDYKGGLRCCYDDTQCRLRDGFNSSKRTIYCRYTIKWVDWHKSIVPIKIYILDVTDTLEISDKSKGTRPNHHCQVEYEVEPCITSHNDVNGCVDVKRTNLPMQTGGYVIYGVAHQHPGAIGSTLYGKDGRVICSSVPSYGNGKEAGNEADYVVGMSTCYPRPGSVKIIDGETLTLESNYSNNRGHTGAMGLFHLFLAEHLPYQQSVADL